MSENVEIVKAFTSLFEAGDRNAWRQHFDPEVVWDTSTSKMPAAGIYHGHEGVERFFREWLGAWSDYRMETRELIDAGDSVVIRLHQWGRGKETGAEVDSRTWQVFTFRDGKIVHCRGYPTKEEALAAAGLDA